MRVRIVKKDISNAVADGLFVPIDGQICILGGTVAAKALKASLPEDERQDLWEYLERDVKSLRPMRHGEARVIPGDGGWEWLVVVAAVPHHADDVIFSKAQFAGILKASIANGIRASVAAGLGSIAMTVIADSYRLPSEAAIRSMVEAMHECRREEIAVEWHILDQEKFDAAVKAADQLSLPFESI